MIKEKFLYYKTRHSFDQDLANGNIVSTHIAFIEDERLIWTHNKFFGDSQTSGMTEEERQMLEELYNSQHPLKVTISVSPSVIEKTDQPYTATITYTVQKVGDIIPTRLTLNGQIITPQSSGTITKTQITADSTTYTITATYGSETATASATTKQILKTYYGFDSNNPSLQNLTGQLITSASGMSGKTIPNGTEGYYLWIVTPFNITKIATDESFVYEVKMSKQKTEGGYNWYRSADSIAPCSLTYYVK